MPLPGSFRTAAISFTTDCPALLRERILGLWMPEENSQARNPSSAAERYMHYPQPLCTDGSYFCKITAHSWLRLSTLLARSWKAIPSLLLSA